MRAVVPSTRIELPGDTLAASTARGHLRSTLTEWRGWDVPGAAYLGEPLVEDALLLASELVTNAVLHTGTPVGLACRLDPGGLGGEPCGLVVEVTDRQPERVVQTGNGDEGRGLRVVSVIAESWGVTYRGSRKTVWFRLPLAGGTAHPEPRGEIPAEAAPASPGPGHPVAETVPPTVATEARGGTGPSVRPAERTGMPSEQTAAPVVAAVREPETSLTGGVEGSEADLDWLTRGALGFLAEASDLLAGQTDEEKVVSLAAQLVVPRLGDWCAIWCDDDRGGPPRLAQVWHSSEERIEEVRAALEQHPPTAGVPLRGTAVSWPWPGDASAYGPGGAAVACRLVAGDRPVGALLIGRAGLLHIPGEIMALIEDFSRRVALAVVAARRYTRQATISEVLQRGLLPSGVARIPGVETAVVYEPAGGEAWAGGDFYDVFATGDGRWCFALGDVCGNGPEAAVVTGVARPVLRALAREGHGVAAVLDRLNREMGEQTRFLSLLYGEFSLTGHGTLKCSVVSAGHPLPMVLERSGRVHEPATPQLLLGLLPDITYRTETFELRAGDTLLCVTDGVTERRSGKRQFDDDGRLTGLLAQCAGMSAAAIAERVRRAVHSFDAAPPTDDLALLVVQPMDLTAEAPDQADPPFPGGTVAGDGPPLPVEGPGA